MSAEQWKWVQPATLDDLLARLSDARDLKVPERERENLCAVSFDYLIKLRRENERMAAALDCAIPALSEASSDYNASNFTDRHGTGPRLKAALDKARASRSGANP
ncbi:MAG: hypothetical protein WC736_15135 [Gallionella sp.]|jgi:hypothetical protein